MDGCAQFLADVAAFRTALTKTIQVAKPTWSPTQIQDVSRAMLIGTLISRRENASAGSGAVPPHPRH